MRKIILSITIIIFITVITVIFFQKPDKPAVTIRGHTFTVEIADNASSRQVGLGNRTSVAQNTGMLFIFNTPAIEIFWMKDTLIPLDMIFINNDRIVTIHRNVLPQPTTSDAGLTRYASTQPVNYVLEINGGLSDKFGFTEGDAVTIKRP